MLHQDLTVADEIILIGAVEIGRFVMRTSRADENLTDKQLARKIYHLVRTSRLPVFRLGSRIALRPHVYRAWVAEQEKQNSHH